MRIAVFPLRTVDVICIHPHKSTAEGPLSCCGGSCLGTSLNGLPAEIGIFPIGTSEFGRIVSKLGTSRLMAECDQFKVSSRLKFACFNWCRVVQILLGVGTLGSEG